MSAKILPDGRWQGFVRDISVRQQLERALQASLADLSRAQSVARLGSWRLDMRRNELLWSDEAYRIFGVSPGTPMTYEGFLACVHPDDRAYVEREWGAALDRRPYDIEHRVIADGTIKWVREKAALEFDEHQALVGGIGITLDITDRKRAEEELRLAEAKASGIVSISADAIISIDEAQRITIFNEGAEKIFGYSKAEAIGAPLEMLMPERFRAGHRQHVERFAVGEEAARRMGNRSMPIVGRRRTGEEFPADAAISRLEVGGNVLLTVALRDVTEQRRIQDQQTFLSQLGSVLAASLDLDATLTSIGRLVTQALADACIIYALEEGEVRRLKTIVREPEREWICDVLARIPIDRSRVAEVWSELEAGRSVLMERLSPERVAGFAQSEEHRRALRALDPRSVIMAPLYANRTLVGALALISWKPGRVYAPEDVRFAEQVADRAALAMDNARLYAEERRAVQTRDDVLGIVAHDLRNPLNSILMQTELIARLGNEAALGTQNRLGAIRRAVTRMSRLIEDLLDVTRMEAGPFPLQCARASARQLVSDSVESQQPLAASASLELRLGVTGELPEVWADRHRVIQILENLIGNAVKFTHVGGSIIVGAAALDGEVVFSVADTGAGIAAEDLPRVFDRFWQVGKRERHGAGLGLAIARGLVEAHGGRIWVESTPGRGTTFFFTIPAAARVEEPRGVSAPRGS